MKKLTVLLIVIVMLIMVGCQGKSISQNEMGNGQTISNGAANTSSQMNDGISDEDSKDSVGTTDTAEIDKKDSEGTSTDKNQGSNTEANNNDKAEDKKTQGSNTKEAVKPPPEEKKSEPGSFTLFISKNKGTEEVLRKKLQIEGNASLLDYLRNNVSVLDDGGFIKSIEGLKAITSKDLTSDQKNAGIMGVDWFIYQNEVKTKSGAGDIVPKNGEVLNLDYREWTYKDMAP